MLFDVLLLITLNLQKKSYFENTIKIEFKPKGKYLKFTSYRHGMLHEGADMLIDILLKDKITQYMSKEDI